MTDQRLRSEAEYLRGKYGRQRRAAEVLHVHEDMMRTWLTGKRRVPGWRVVQIRAVLELGLIE